MGEPAVEVREAAPDEYGVIAKLTVDSYSEFAERFSRSWWRYYRRDLGQVAERAERGPVLVAVAAGQVVGAVSYYPAAGHPTPDSSRPADWAHLRALAVHPGWRGRGIGRRLTEACVARARGEGAAAISLNTTFVMEVARRMYEQMGFEQLAEHTDWAEGLYWTYVLHLPGPG